MPRIPSTSRVRRATKRSSSAARASSSTRAARTSATLAPAVASELKNALAALRAALEGVANDLRSDDPRLERVLRAAVQTLPLARQVEALADCARSTGASTGACTLGELVHSVRCALQHGREARLLVALEDAASTFAVDAPLAVRTLVLPIESLLAHGRGPVLLHARLSKGAPALRITWPGAQPEPEALALQRQLLRHEARCLGAKLVEGAAPRALEWIELRFARAPRGGKRR